MDGERRLRRVEQPIRTAREGLAESARRALRPVCEELAGDGSLERDVRKDEARQPFVEARSAGPKSRRVGTVVAGTMKFTSRRRRFRPFDFTLRWEAWGGLRVRAAPLLLVQRGHGGAKLPTSVRG